MQAFLVETMALRSEPVFTARLDLGDQNSNTPSYVVDVMPLEIEPEFIARPLNVGTHTLSGGIQH